MCATKIYLTVQLISTLAYKHGPKTGRHNIRYPLPPIAHRIVLPGSYWNLGKTGGDTLTRLFDEVDA